MPPEILIMCTQCGRPQLARGQPCIACGAPLAPPVEPRPLNARDRLLDDYAPAMECDLGMGRKLLLSARRLEWRPRSGRGLSIELKQLESAFLETRPVWESLFLFSIGAAAAVVLPGWMRWAALAFSLLALAACFLQRRFGLYLRLHDGQVHRIFLGIGRSDAPVVERIESVWSSLSEALHRLGIDAEPKRGRRSPPEVQPPQRG